MSHPPLFEGTGIHASGPPIYQPQKGGITEEQRERGMGEDYYESWGAAQERAAREARLGLEGIRSGEDSAAQAQMQQAIGAGQRNITAMAASRGANPLASRAAMMAGGQMQTQGAMQTAQLRAQEMQGARQQYLQQIQAQAAGYQTQEQMQMRASEAQAQLDMAQRQLELAETEAEREFWGKMVTAGVSAAAAVATSGGSVAAQGAAG